MTARVTIEDVQRAAAEIFTPDGVAIWMDHPQRVGGLNGLTPRQAVEAGRGQEAIAIIEGLADGVVW